MSTRLAAALPHLLVAAAAMLVAWAIDHRADQRGYQRAQTQIQAQQLASADRQLASLSDTLRRSVRLADTLDQITTVHQQAQAHETRKIDRLDADLRAGRLRLFVPTVPAQPTSDATAAAGLGQARAELDPAAAAALVRVAADGDAAIGDLNACIDSYAAARRELNLPTP